MAMIKLDDGDYVNTNTIKLLFDNGEGDWCLAFVGELTADSHWHITEADRDRIIAAMNGGENHGD